MAKEEQETRNWPDPAINFKAIAASVFQASLRSAEAQLTGSTLIQLSFFSKTVQDCFNPKCNELIRGLRQIREEGLQYLAREFARNKLITAIGILDFCFYELLVFMIGTHPNLLNTPNALKGLPKRKPEEDALEYAKRFLRHTSIERRLDLVKDLLGVDIPQALRQELDALLTKRHEITHHSKYYEATPYKATVVMEARAFPEVSYDEAMLAGMVSTEICDEVLTTVGKNFFDTDLGDLRPLNSAIARFNQEMRRKITERRSREPAIKEIADAGWEVMVFKESFVSVIDREKLLSLAATGIENFPVMLNCFKHNAHGKKAYFKIDDDEREEFGLHDSLVLSRLLSGKSLLVEYNTEFSDFPLLVRLPLAGFDEAWRKAVEIKTTKKPPPS